LLEHVANPFTLCPFHIFTFLAKPTPFRIKKKQKRIQEFLRYLKCKLRRRAHKIIKEQAGMIQMHVSPREAHRPLFFSPVSAEFFSRPTAGKRAAAGIVSSFFTLVP
jgi:hypothetical protein